MKKVAIFLISLRGGGAERIVSYLLNEGYKEFEFHLILLQREIEYPLPKSSNIKIVELGGKSESKFMDVLKIPLLARKLKKYLMENGIETLLTLLNRPNLIACCAKKNGWKGKLIISERSNTMAWYRSVRFGPFMIHMVKRYYPYADVVTAVSKGVARDLQRLGIDNCRTIYNPVHVSIPCVTRQKSVKQFTFISIGRLEPPKNQALLLKSFAKMNEANCRLRIIGKGFQLEQLKELAVSLGIEEKTSFEGFQSDVQSFLTNADCFVCSSDYEGFPNVVLEALGAGVPVISTDCPYGPREILAPETDTDTLNKDRIDIARYGILSPPGDVNCMAEAMYQMMTSEELRNKYRELASGRASDFDIKKIAKQYFDLF